MPLSQPLPPAQPGGLHHGVHGLLVDGLVCRWTLPPLATVIWHSKQVKSSSSHCCKERRPTQRPCIQTRQPAHCTHSVPSFSSSSLAPHPWHFTTKSASPSSSSSSMSSSAAASSPWDAAASTSIELVVGAALELLWRGDEGGLERRECCRGLREGHLGGHKGLFGASAPPSGPLPATEGC